MFQYNIIFQFMTDLDWHFNIRPFFLFKCILYNYAYYPPTIGLIQCQYFDKDILLHWTTISSQATVQRIIHIWYGWQNLTPL